MIPQVPEGLVAQYEHCRNYDPVIEGYTENTVVITPTVSPCGGTTICRILDENRVVVAVGEALCADNDQYVKKIGRDISLGRALKELDNGTNNS